VALTASGVAWWARATTDHWVGMSLRRSLPRSGSMTAAPPVEKKEKIVPEPEDFSFGP
jgi:hypothetical protein